MRYGFFGRLAVEQYGYQYQGMDIASDAVEHAATRLGLDVTCGNLLERRFGADERFDIICLWDVLEHLTDPADHIRCLSSVLSEGGSLLLTTGDIGSPLARLQGRRWRLIHPPTHVHYFTRRSLGALLATAGLTISHASYVGHTRELRSMFATMATFAGSHSLRARVLHWLAQRVPALKLTINLYDLMFVCAQRAS